MISIIIPVYNNLNLTIDCITSLLNYIDYSINYEIIISDDCSNDETNEYFSQITHKKIKYRRNSKNHGFAYTCNRGAEIAKGDFLLFLNNDCIIYDNILTKFLKTFDKYPNTAIVGAKLLYEDKTIQHAGVVIFPTFSIDHIFRHFPENYHGVNKLRKLRIVTGACLMIPKKIFFEIGMFDENFKNGFEDVDLCLKAFYKGYNIIYNPEIHLFHLENKTRNVNPTKPSEQKNSKYLFFKWKEKLTPDYYFLLKEGFDFKFNEAGELYIIKKKYIKILPNNIDLLKNLISNEPLNFLAFKKLIQKLIENNKLDDAFFYCNELLKYEPILENFYLLKFISKLKKNYILEKKISKVIDKFQQNSEIIYKKFKLKLTQLLNLNYYKEASYYIDWFINNGYAQNEKKLIKYYFEQVKRQYKYRQPKISNKIKENIKQFKYKPLISILMPVYNVEKEWLKKAINSIKKQWYNNWELCIVDDCSEHKGIKTYLKKINHPKIKISFLKKNLGISEASNEALKMARGEYIALLDHDDELTPNALYEVVKVLNKKKYDIIYSDEDKIDFNGFYCDPHFKPDFSYDMFLSQNYINHLCVLKTSIVKKIGGWRKGFEGAQDYDLFLRIIKHTKNIFHIPKVLYHWRKVVGSTSYEFSSKSYAQEAGRKAIESYLKASGIKAIVKNGKIPGTYKINYFIKKKPLVSIIIPFKDNSYLLRKCLNSILSKTTNENYEVICINNNSIEKETFELIDEFTKTYKQIKFFNYNKPFNFSKINNFAIREFSKGQHIVLLNSDIEIITKNWIEEMVMYSQKSDIGVVGCLLYYPDGTIQHAGIILGIGGVAGHSHKYFNKNNPGYFGRIFITQNLSAVTGAFMMFKRKVFDEVKGFDERLKIAFNDVDFCLKVREKGYRNIYTPWVEAYHYESKTRGYEDTNEKIKRFKKEYNYMKKKWGKILKNDPYYNPNLTLEKEDFSLKFV